MPTFLCPAVRKTVGGSVASGCHGGPGRRGGAIAQRLVYPGFQRYGGCLRRFPEERALLSVQTGVKVRARRLAAVRPDCVRKAGRNAAAQAVAVFRPDSRSPARPGVGDRLPRFSQIRRPFTSNPTRKGSAICANRGKGPRPPTRCRSARLRPKGSLQRPSSGRCSSRARSELANPAGARRSFAPVLTDTATVYVESHRKGLRYLCKPG